MAEAEMSVDVDEVREVVSFYRRAASAVGTAAADIGTHDLGSWAVGDEYRDLGERFREMGRILADRLGEQARAADRLADALHRGMAAIVDADVAVAGDVTRAGRSDGTGS
ncbi:hypothetical protein AAFP35_07745 [Gordonia sp. CPCC 206044]|uniref:hypothetical protein n=1 Tax=Gordonia sp. CPCC 206044 TaxID=3140793 RepID=UPI003AF3F28B